MQDAWICFPITKIKCDTLVANRSNPKATTAGEIVSAWATIAHRRCKLKRGKTNACISKWPFCTPGKIVLFWLRGLHATGCQCFLINSIAPVFFLIIVSEWLQNCSTAGVGSFANHKSYLTLAPKWVNSLYCKPMGGVLLTAAQSANWWLTTHYGGTVRLVIRPSTGNYSRAGISWDEWDHSILVRLVLFQALSDPNFLGRPWTEYWRWCCIIAHVI